MKHAHGSCLAEFGDTRVLCAATIEEGVPGWRKGAKAGWVTAEYAMLPASTKRCKREHANRKGRSMEIERLIGRSLRTVVNMKRARRVHRHRRLRCDPGRWRHAYGEHHRRLGGAARRPRHVGRGGQDRAHPAYRPGGRDLHGRCRRAIRCFDLDYSEDSHAEVDMNLVATDTGEMIELQGTGEQAPFDRKRLNALLDLGDKGIAELIELQRQALA